MQKLSPAHSQTKLSTEKNQSSIEQKKTQVVTLDDQEDHFRQEEILAINHHIQGENFLVDLIIPRENFEEIHLPLADQHMKRKNDLRILREKVLVDLVIPRESSDLRENFEAGHHMGNHLAQVEIYELKKIIHQEDRLRNSQHTTSFP